MAGWKMNRTQRRCSSEHHQQTVFFFQPRLMITGGSHRGVWSNTRSSVRWLLGGATHTYIHIYIYTYTYIHIIYILYIVFSHLANFCQFLLMVRLPLLSNSYFFMSKSQYGKTTPCGWLVAKSCITARMVETQRKSWDAYHLYSPPFSTGVGSMPSAAMPALRASKLMH